MRHDRDDDRLTVGCPECIRLTREAEETARWEQAPLRRVKWTCSYCLPDSDDAGPPESLSFELTVRVPADATPSEVDHHHAGVTGEAFVMALPDSVAIDDTTYACETMEVESVKIGQLVDTTPPVVPQVSLFDSGAVQ